MSILLDPELACADPASLVLRPHGRVARRRNSWRYSSSSLLALRPQPVAIRGHHRRAPGLVRRRIWSEMLSPEDLIRDETLAPLAERGIEMLAAVFPRTAGAAGEMVLACRRHGIRAGLWPMLDDVQGRWANAANAEPFAAFVRGLLRDLGETARPDVVALDLEPSIAEMRAAFRGRPYGAIRRAAR